MSSRRQTKCFMAIWDSHYPHHQPEVIDLFLQLAHDYKPDILIHGGDALDCTAVSSHGPSAKTRVSQPIDLDMEGFDRDILTPFDALGAKTKVLFEGNHEIWLRDRAESQPELGQLLDIEKQLRLRERGWQFIPYKKFWIAPGGKLVFHHGDFRTSRHRAGLVKHHAYDVVSKIHKSIRCGHAHDFQVHAIANQLNPDRPHTGIFVPCSCRLDLPYLENGATNWTQGFLIGWIHSDGTFSDYVCVVVNGRLTFAGKTYTARCRKSRAA